MRIHQPLRALAILFLTPFLVCAQPTRETFIVHGRLISGNGTPACRIWVVGSKRILGVHELQGEIPDMPEKLLDLLAYGRRPDQYRDIYADFELEALTPDRPGHMRIVRIVSASKIVVTKDHAIILTKAHL